MKNVSVADRMELAYRGAEWLYERGASRVWLFGSLAVGRPQDPRSDLDFAVEGLPLYRVRQMVPELESLLGCSVDVVHLESTVPRFRAVIVEQRKLLPRFR